MLNAEEITELQKKHTIIREKELKLAEQRRKDILDGKIVPENKITIKEIESEIKDTAKQKTINWVCYDGKLKSAVIKTLKKSGFKVYLITNKSSMYVPNFDKIVNKPIAVKSGFFKWEKVDHYEPTYEHKDIYNTFTLVYWGDKIPPVLTIEHEKVEEL